MIRSGIVGVGGEAELEKRLLPQEIAAAHMYMLACRAVHLDVAGDSLTRLVGNLKTALEFPGIRSCLRNTRHPRWV